MFAFLLIDMQTGLIDDEPLFQRDETLQTIQSLLARARQAQIPVFYMQDVDVGDGPGTPGFAIHPSVTPLPDETIIVKTEADSFYETDLHDRLQAQGIDTLVIVGLKTEYCVDSTVHRASNLGYRVILVADAHSTTDRDYMTAWQVIQHHNWLLDGIGSAEHPTEVLPASSVDFSIVTS